MKLPLPISQLNAFAIPRRASSFAPASQKSVGRCTALSESTPSLDELDRVRTAESGTSVISGTKHLAILSAGEAFSSSSTASWSVLDVLRACVSCSRPLTMRAAARRSVFLELDRGTEVAKHHAAGRMCNDTVE